ncbi:hypothetical protein B4917_04530, partial [Helicobacter pylori]
FCFEALFLNSLFLNSLFLNSLFLNSLFLNSLFLNSLFLNSLFFWGGFDGKSFLAFLTIWLVKNLILIQAIAFKKALLFGV